MTSGNLGFKADARRLLVCASAPGNGKSTFLEQLLMQTSELKTAGPFVPLSVTFNFNTSLCDLEKASPIEIKDTYKLLLCRLIYKFVMQYYFNQLNLLQLFIW